MSLRIGWVLLLLCVAGFVGPAGAVGAALPVLQPEGSYVTDDPAASYINARPGGRARYRQMINAAIQKNPRNVSALSHRAYLFMEVGDSERALRDFDAALAAAEPNGPHERHLLWSRGWANYDQGDYAATFADWQRAITLHGGSPFWAAYSMALLYASTGQTDVALQWYTAAVAANAEWGTSEGMEHRIRKWTVPQREQMRALFAAWLEMLPADD